MRHNELLLLTPMNTYLLTYQGDRIEDFFLSVPNFEFANSNIRFRDSENLLLCIDGVPIPVENRHYIPFFAIDHIEVLGEGSNIWGNYDGVINIFTKEEYTKPYSKVALTKNPSSAQFLLGRKVRKLDILVSYQDSVFFGSCGIKKGDGEIKIFLLKDSPIFKVAYHNMQIGWNKEYLSLSSNIDIKGHKISYGGEKFGEDRSIFIIDHFRLFPLFYIAPSLRYNTNFYPKISLLYIPDINFPISCSWAKDELNIGVRFHDNGLTFYNKKEANGFEFYLNTLLFKNFRLYSVGSIPSPLVNISESQYGFLIEYDKSFKMDKLGIKITYHIVNKKENFLRFEFRILDIKFYLRFIEESYPFYGFSWEFWN